MKKNAYKITYFMLNGKGILILHVSTKYLVTGFRPNHYQTENQVKIILDQKCMEILGTTI